MKTLWKITKWGLYIFGGAILIVTLITFLFMTFSPQFGGKISKVQKAEFEKLDHYEDGKFINKLPIDMDISFKSIIEMSKEMFSPHEEVVPKKRIDVNDADLSTLNNDSLNNITWLGHSSFYIKFEDQSILIDPIFSDYAAPHQWFGRKRFNDKMPFELSEIEEVDVLIISHDHYDHLDYKTIDELKDKVKRFVVPLGVGAHLKAWKITEDRITELDWWDECELGSVKYVLTPSRHASGRGMTDQSATLWGSWCFISDNQRIYFSGDGGYDDHFKQIGEKYGPFDFAMLECGQYNEKWEGMHMYPEETVQAGIDVQAKVMMPIHWGAFSLAPHAWYEPVERFKKQADLDKVNYCLPQIGSTIHIGDKSEQREWWLDFQ